jgi:mono/diheme cytochrome c family protein
MTLSECRIMLPVGVSPCDQDAEDDMRFLKGVGTAVVLFVVVVAAIIFSGVFNVAATWPDNAVVEWVLHTAMKRAVQTRAGAATRPPATDEEIRAGAHFYSDACVYCHGGPGKDPVDIGKGLNPEPPFLADVVGNWTTAQLFWIVKNGVRMTGMPSFGVSHKDEEIVNVVAFIQQLPKMTPEQYDKLTQ